MTLIIPLSLVLASAFSTQTQLFTLDNLFHKKSGVQKPKTQNNWRVLEIDDGGRVGAVDEERGEVLGYKHLVRWRLSDVGCGTSLGMWDRW